MDWNTGRIILEMLANFLVIASPFLAVCKLLYQLLKKNKVNLLSFGLITSVFVIASLLTITQDIEIRQLRESIELLSQQNTDLRHEIENYDGQSVEWLRSIGSDLMNKKQYTAAQALVNAALEKYPGNDKLKALQTQIKQKSNTSTTTIGPKQVDERQPGISMDARVNVSMEVKLRIIDTRTGKLLEIIDARTGKSLDSSGK
jgi:cell division protein FtsB